MKKVYNKPETLIIDNICQPVMLNVYSGNGDTVVNDPNDVLSKRHHGNTDDAWEDEEEESE